MVEIFEPVIKEILGLVESQVTTATKAGDTIHQVFLVGGFGSSTYLNARLSDWCQQRNITLKSPAAW
jgi:hypothetical protein